jgi:hypothetical protein
MRGTGQALAQAEEAYCAVLNLDEGSSKTAPHAGRVREGGRPAHHAPQEEKA